MKKKFSITIALLLMLVGCSSKENVNIPNNTDEIMNKELDQNQDKEVIVNTQFEIVNGVNEQTFNSRESDIKMTIHSIILIDRKILTEEEFKAVRLIREEGPVLKIDATIENLNEQKDVQSFLGGMLYNSKNVQIGEYVETNFSAEKQILEKYKMLNSNHNLLTGERIRGYEYIEIYSEKDIDMNEEYKIIVSPLYNPIEWTIRVKR